MDEYKGLLTAAFAETDTISYGPFTITKAPGKPWRHAHAFVEGQEVFLAALKKQYLALLISQKGETVTMDDFSASIPGSNASRWYEIAKTRDDVAEKRDSRKELGNTIKVTVSQLRSDLRRHDVPESTIALISAAAPYRAGGGKGIFDPLVTAAYRLRLPLNG